MESNHFKGVQRNGSRQSDHVACAALCTDTRSGRNVADYWEGLWGNKGSIKSHHTDKQKGILERELKDSDPYAHVKSNTKVAEFLSELWATRIDRQDRSHELNRTVFLSDGRWVRSGGCDYDVNTTLAYGQAMGEATCSGESWQANERHVANAHTTTESRTMKARNVDRDGKMERRSGSRFSVRCIHDLPIPAISSGLATHRILHRYSASRNG